MIRILLTSDLHYDVARSREPTERIARDICAAGGDVLVFVGDSASIDLAILERSFGLFDAFRGPKLFTPGNHDLWTAPGGDSLLRYERELPDVCRRNGVQYLDHAPFVADGAAIVGNVGWYDYTFRPAALRIPLRFYQAKLAPGTAAARDEFRHLVDGHDDLPSHALDVLVRWMDGVHVRLGRSDVEFTQACVERLRTQLDAVAPHARTVVAAIHHLPFVELVPRTIAPHFAFVGAFLGSELFGELLLQYPQVSHVFCGHAHRGRTIRKGRLAATCIASTYTEKAYEVLDL